MFDSLLSGKKTIVMGILNCTPDSFSDGGEYYDDIKKILSRIDQMISEGADIIDIGGESSRPGSKPVGEKEELRRVLPVIKAIRKQLGPNILLSIDTYRSAVAEQALEAQVDIVNSLGGFTYDKKMATVVAKARCPIIIYHIYGVPQTMQQKTNASENIIFEIKCFFEEQMKIGRKVGITEKQFLFDPGFGFGKTVKQNMQMIEQFSTFKELHRPMVVGISRKSHIGKILQDGLDLDGIPSENERLEGALAETALLVQKGAKIVRTHDVCETKRFLTVFDTVRFYES